MPKFNVHVYREMRLKFIEIEANTMEEAAQMVRDMRTEDAIEIEDCEGTTIAALVDTRGD